MGTGVGQAGASAHHGNMDAPAHQSPGWHLWQVSAAPRPPPLGLKHRGSWDSLGLVANPTNYYRSNIRNDGTDPMCRICGQFQETIDHIVAGCPELAKTEYLHRHDKAASYLHWNICKELNINVEEKWYEHEPQTVTEKDNITILWDMPIQTDREIKANRPDIVIKDKQEKSCLLIDMSIPTEKNTSVKVTEKLSKYKDLEIEIE